MSHWVVLVISIVFQGYASAQNTFPSTGKVGIGTVSPASPLQVNLSDNNFAVGIALVNPNTGSNAQAKVSLQSGTGTGYLFQQGASTVLWNNNNGPLLFATNAKQQMTILGNGNVGVGTLSPNQSLTIGATLVAGTPLSGTANTPGLDLYMLSNGQAYMDAVTAGSSSTQLIFRTYNGGVYNSAMTIAGNGYVGIGTQSLSSMLTVAGSVTASGFTMSSDERLKENIEPLKRQLANIGRLKAVGYNWNSVARARGIADTAHQTGFLAQDVEQVFPNAVHTAADGYKSVNYLALLSPVVAALQELHVESTARITQLENQLREERLRNSQLEKRIERLENK